MLRILVLMGLVCAPLALGTRCTEALHELGKFQSYHAVSEEEPPAVAVYRLRRKFGSKTEIRFLGRGGEAAVFRVVEENGKISIHRVFLDPREEVALFIDFDMRFYQLGAKLPQGKHRFVLPSGAEKDWRWLWIRYDDVRGYDFRWFLSTIKDRKPDLYEALIEKYNERVDNLASDLRKRKWKVQARSRQVRHQGKGIKVKSLEAVPEEGKFVDSNRIVLRLENIILDPETETMTLIEPG